MYSLGHVILLCLAVGFFVYIFRDEPLFTTGSGLGKIIAIVIIFLFFLLTFGGIGLLFPE